jgi:hypothetical protein
MQGPLTDFVGEGLLIIDQCEALPKIKTASLRKAFEHGRLHWSRVWQFVVLGHWLKSNFSRQQSLPDLREQPATVK